jgi:hypothetical protein
MNTISINVQHAHVEEFLECVKTHAFTSRCVEEGETQDRFEVDFIYPFQLFYFGQSYGLSVGFKVCRNHYNQIVK